MVDLIIQNGLLVDPENKITRPGCVCIAGGSVCALTERPAEAGLVIDARGLAVAPGFIDVHAHADIAGDDALALRCARLSLMQGVTTLLSGNCGASAPDVSGYLKKMDRGFPVNHGILIGATSTLRAQIGVEQVRAALSQEQIARVCALADRALLQGAFGISMGPGYVPGATVGEMTQIARVAAKYDRVVAVDTRMQDAHDVDASLGEVFQIARGSGARVQVSHLVYQYGEGAMGRAISALRCARAEGLNIRADSGLYAHWTTGMDAEMFCEEYIEAHPEILPFLLVLTGPHAGLRLENIKDFRHMRACHGRDSVACLTGEEDAVFEALAEDFVMVSSDTAGYQPGEGHPQVAGSFARFFRMTREKKLFSLEEAIYRATLLPAKTFGIEKKGRLAAGADADLVVFNPALIADRAEFIGAGAPDAPPEGIDYVIVNGKIACEKGTCDRILHGRGLRAGR